MFICKNSGCTVASDNATAEELIDAGIHPEDVKTLMGIMQKHREANSGTGLTGANEG